MDGLEEFQGQGRESKGMGGMLTTGIPKAWWGVRPGISTGDKH